MFNPKSTTMTRFVIDGEYLDEELGLVETVDLFEDIDMDFSDLID